MASPPAMGASWHTRYRRWVLSRPWAIGAPLWVLTHAFVFAASYLGPRRWAERRERLRSSDSRLE